MFTADQLARNFFIRKGRGFTAGLARSNAANNGAAFVFYNPPAAALATFTTLLITKLDVASDDEPQGVTVQWSDDVTGLNALTGVLAADNHIPNLIDGATDPDTKVAIEEENGLTVTIDATFWRAQTGANQPGQLLNIEYPLILPPGNAIIVRFGDRPNTSTSRLNVCWFRV